MNISKYAKTIFLYTCQFLINIKRILGWDKIYLKKTDLKKLEKIDFNREFKEQHLLFDYLTLTVNYFQVASALGLCVTHRSFTVVL